MPGDYNGDGNTDLLCRGLVGLPAGPWIAFSNGIGAFTHEGAWADVACDGSDQRGLGDFNGDGKADLYCYDDYGPAQTRKTFVGLSDGSDFHTGEWLGPLGCQRFSIADMNGDGRNDVWCHQDTTWNTYVALSNGTDGFDDVAPWATNWCGANKMIAGDFSGDTKTDIACVEDSGTSLAYSGSIQGRTDVLTLINGSLGGTTTVTYVPGTEWTSTLPPPPAQLSSVDGNNEHSSTPSIQPRPPGIPTVSKVEVDDGRLPSATATTTYYYANSLYDVNERVSLGFQYATVVHPKLLNEASGPLTVTQYHMTVAAAGAVVAQTSYDGSVAWNELDAVANQIVTSGDGKTEPYTAKVTARSSYLFDGSGIDCPSYPCANGEMRSQEFEYDAYGNRTQVLDHGNYAASGDESTTLIEYYPNTVDYIVNRPARTISYFGLGVSVNVLSDARTYYDGALSHTDPPSLGFVTKSDVWLNTESRYVAQCSQPECILYDANGNVTKTIDTKGGETTFVYDMTYQKFVLSVTNPLGHVTAMPEADWDVLCEAPGRVKDPNQQESTTIFDALCRHKRSDGPAGTGVYSESFYELLGDPNAQYTETRSPSPDGTGFYWTRTLFDGFGRSYRTESKSGEPGKTVVSGEVTFNARGLTASAAQPRFDGDPQFATTFTYDVRNRVTRKEYADCNPTGSAETFLYGLNYSMHTNPDGEYTVTSRDATGLVTYFVEYLGGSPIYTTTVRDPKDFETAVYDNESNFWYTRTDSLGRPVAILDPDSSWEAREYYDSGELEATVNLLGERTELTYDGLGRVLTKTTRAGTPSAQVTTFTYDLEDASYSNVGTLSRMDDSEGYETYDYDALGRPKRKRRNLDTVDYTFVFSYNAAGLPSSTLYPDAQTIAWTYDAAGNLETETGTITASSYDAAGRPETRDFTNGIVSTMSYDPARGWVDSIYASDSQSPPVQDLTYAHNRDGTIASVTSAKPMESWIYTYDDLNRLKTATNVDTPALSQSFLYYDNGNIKYNSHIGTYSYPLATNPRPHAVATAGSRSYLYNAIGQMTNRNGTIIQWNGDGKPSSIGNVVFAYDGVGGRLKKTSSGQTTRWIGGDYEIAPNGTVTKYLAGGKQVGTSFFALHTDHLGSIQGVTDATGTEVRRQDHTPFGDQHFVSGSHQESKGWIGEREEETELVYLNARYYDPEIGRFTAPDPVVRLGQKLNRYSYATNNPISVLDPSGLDGITTCEAYTDDDGNVFLGPCGGGPQLCSSGGSDPLCQGWQGLYFSGFGLSPSQMAALEIILGSDNGEDRARQLEDEARGTSSSKPPGWTGCGNGYSPCSTPGPTEPADPGSGPPDGPPGDDPGPTGPSVDITPGEVRTQTVVGITDVRFGGFDVSVSAFGTDIKLATNVLGSQACVGSDGSWSSGSCVTASTLPVPNSIAGTSLGRLAGFRYPMKLNRAGVLQPFDPLNGRYLSYAANDGLRFGAMTRFGTGFGAGVGAAQGATGPQPVGAAGNLGYMIGYTFGTFGF